MHIVCLLLENIYIWYVMNINSFIANIHRVLFIFMSKTHE